MIIPAKLIELQLRAAAAESVLRDGARFRWYQITSSAPHLLDLDTSDWARIERASVSGAGETLTIHGFMSASIDRECNTVSQMGAFSIREKSPTYLRDLLRFIEHLQCRFDLVRWGVVIGNPAERIWEAAAKRLGGGPVGVFRRYALLSTGEAADMRWYEIPGRPKGKE